MSSWLPSCRRYSKVFVETVHSQSRCVCGLFHTNHFFNLQLIQKGTKLVLEQVVTSIASVADTAEEKFVPYYDMFMPSLKHIVENAVQKELRLLRGKTIECISLIGLAVGKEKVYFDHQSIPCAKILIQGYSL